MKNPETCTMPRNRENTKRQRGWLHAEQRRNRDPIYDGSVRRFGPHSSLDRDFDELSAEDLVGLDVLSLHEFGPLGDAAVERVVFRTVDAETGWSSSASARRRKRTTSTDEPARSLPEEPPEGWAEP